MEHFSCFVWQPNDYYLPTLKEILETLKWLNNSEWKKIEVVEYKNNLQMTINNGKILMHKSSLGTLTKFLYRN